MLHSRREAARQISPGQRPGNRPTLSPERATKFDDDQNVEIAGERPESPGFERLFGPFKAGPRVVDVFLPGRCPGLICRAPAGQQIRLRDNDTGDSGLYRYPLPGRCPGLICLEFPGRCPGLICRAPAGRNANALHRNYRAAAVAASRCRRRRLNNAFAGLARAQGVPWADMSLPFRDGTQLAQHQKA
jgi:hypothetical protein